MPTSVQIAGWNTATRADLTGPFTPTANTNVNDEPAIESGGFVGGYRMTIMSMTFPRLHAVRISAEVFASAAAATAAQQYYVSAFTSMGYTNPASTGNLPDTSWAMSATNGFIAPEFAVGTAPKVYAFVWRSGNLLITVRAGGDETLTATDGLQWASLVNSNIPPR
jgi:hypothetical protein